jgi:hypothetical protein
MFFWLKEAINPTTLPPAPFEEVICREKEIGWVLFKKRDIRRPLQQRKSLYVHILFINEPRLKLAYNLDNSYEFPA